MTFVPLSRPPVDDEIKRAVLAAIDSRQYILGPQCRQLENLPGMGDGGAVLTGDDEIADRCHRLRDHEEIDRVIATVRAFFGA